jgi:ribose transport system substrate-binding protein
METLGDDVPSDRQPGRRDFMKISGLVGLGGLLAPSLAACSSVSTAGSSSTAGASAAGIGPGVAQQPMTLFKGSTKTGEKPPVPRRTAAGMNSISTPTYAALLAQFRKAGQERGAEVIDAEAEGDPAKNIAQLQTFMSRGVGGLFMFDLDVDAQRPVMRKFMDGGTSTFAISNGPATTNVCASTIQIGQTLAKGAIEHINTVLGGKAEVVMFNLDNLAGTRSLWAEVRKAFKALAPNVKIVADVTWQQADPDFGFKTMNSVLQAHPNTKVVVGDDPVVASALAAVEAAKKVTPDMYFAGVGGSPQAFEKIKQAGPYKVSLGINWEAVGYACGMYAVDWIDGKEIPNIIVMDLPALNADGLAKMAADNKDIPNTFSKYMTQLGAINYSTRQQYWNSKDPNKNIVLP